MRAEGAVTAKHGDPGGPCFALRVEVESRVIACTGDTEWTESIVEAASDADLLIAEAYFRDKRVPLHLDLAALEAHLPDISPKRLILTHISDDVLPGAASCRMRPPRMD